MNPALPPQLAAALERLLEGASRRDIRARAAAISAAYRSGETSSGITDADAALAYAVARMPATYAACAAVCARLRQAMPDFAPASLLDMGAGPGTASWAAALTWPGLEAVTMRDPNAALRALAGQLVAQGPSTLAQATIAEGTLVTAAPHADLVIASYVLAERPAADAAAIATELWPRADHVLVLVEPGTPQGFARIRAARAALIAAGAHVAAPCTHEDVCPMRDEDWCHFSQRLPRLRAHMQAKGAEVPFEDERYSFIAVSRTHTQVQGGRILSPPLEQKPGITLKLCTADGLDARFVPRRDKPAYARARRLGWGDLF